MQFHNMAENKKLLIGGIVVFFIILGSLLWIKSTQTKGEQHPNPNVNQPKEVDETEKEGFSLYEHPSKAYSIKYPSDWKVSEADDATVFSNMNTQNAPEQTEGYAQGEQFTAIIHDAKELGFANVQAFIDIRKNSDFAVKSELFTSAQKTFTKIVAESPGGNIASYYYILNQSLVLELTMYPYEDINFTRLFETQILSTLKISTPDLKTFIQNDFGDKVVYKEATPQSVANTHCLSRGGVLNTCGSPCQKGAEVCIEVCALTCDIGK